MRVRIYGGGYAELGATRYEIESIIVKADVLESVRRGEQSGEPNRYIEIDPDVDTERLIEYRDDLDAAMLRAQEIYDRDTAEPIRSAYGAVTVQKQVVDWFVEEDGIAHWENVGDSEEISDKDAYRDWKAEQPEPGIVSTERLKAMNADIKRFRADTQLSRIHKRRNSQRG